MVKENQKSLVRLKSFLDVLMILISFFMAYYVRFYTNLISESVMVFSMAESFAPILLSLPLYLLLYQVFDLYNPRMHFGIFEVSLRILKSNIYGMLIIILALFLVKWIDYSRWTLALFFAVNIVLTSVERVLFQMVWSKRTEDERFLKKCLIIGCNELSQQLLHNLSIRKEWGYKVVGLLDDYLGGLEQLQKIYNNYSILGTIDTLDLQLVNHEIDVVIIALHDANYIKLGEIISSCERAGVKTQIVPYYYRYIPSKPYMDDLDGIPIIDTRHVPLDNFIKKASKRAFDVLFSLVALFLTSPLFLLSIIMVKLSSKGPVFYRQERVGQNRKNFDMLKFRSMIVQDSEDEKSKWTTKDDPRKTKWGSFMRKTSIDELPQFINVLLGDMSVVGPRPERPFFVEQFKDQIPKYMIKHQVRPGITGWAQVNGWRGDTSIESRIECDLYYIENWKFSFDVKIILLTIFKGFINKNAY